MSKHVFLVTWTRPSKVFKDERVNEFDTFTNKEDAEAWCKRLNRIRGIHDVELQETEITSLQKGKIYE